MQEHGMKWKRKGKIFFIILLGTCCAFAIFQSKDEILHSMQKKAKENLVWLGFKENDVLWYISRDAQKGKNLLPSISLLDYLAQNQEELAVREEESASSFALLYPGKTSHGRIWSGAAARSYRGEEWLAEASDLMLADEDDIDEKETVTTMVEMDADAEAIDAVLQENRKYTSQDEQTKHDQAVSAKENIKKIKHLQDSQSLSYLLQNFYIVDSSTSIDKKIFNVDALLHTSLSMKKKNEPQILIFHTHGASEHFIDSDPDKISESVVGVGGILADILEKNYGYQVIHDETQYDLINGKIDRNKAYNKAYDGLKKTLKKYPSLQVVIDLHRDGVGAHVHRITTIDGKRTAQVMFFNGLSRNRKGDIQYLKNENLQANLAFSLQMKMASMKLYPGFAKPVYLKSYRYNLHLRRRSLLIELGNENNTLQEAKNAMEPLAKVLNEVLSGK